MNKSGSRILIVVNVFQPDLGGGILFSDLCEGLHERGYQIRVKCAIPYYPQWKDTTSQNGLQIYTDTSLGFPLERHGLFIPSNPNSLVQRLLYEASFFFSLVRRLPKRHEYDAILVFSPLIGSVAYALLASFRSKAPVWLNVQDLSAQAAAAGGISGPNIVSKLLLFVQNALFRRCDLWSTISEPMQRTLKSIPRAPKKVYYVPNWLHASLSSRIEQRKSKAEHDPANQPRAIKLLYSGNVGGKQNLLEFCQFLHSQTFPFTFIIQAEGAQLAPLKAWIEHVQDARFTLRGLSDEAGLVEALYQTDFYVITEKPGAGNSFIPSKLIPCISTGTPVLGVCDADGPLGLEMNEHDLGAQFTWDRLLEIGPLLEDYVVNTKLQTIWKTNTLSRSTFYNRTSGIDRCVSMLEKAIELKK